MTLGASPIPYPVPPPRNQYTPFALPLVSSHRDSPSLSATWRGTQTRLNVDTVIIVGCDTIDVFSLGPSRLIRKLRPTIFGRFSFRG